jgi:hypothetical protein
LSVSNSLLNKEQFDYAEKECFLMGNYQYLFSENSSQNCPNSLNSEHKWLSYQAPEETISVAKSDFEAEQIYNSRKQARETKNEIDRCLWLFPQYYDALGNTALLKIFGYCVSHFSNTEAYVNNSLDFISLNPMVRSNIPLKGLDAIMYDGDNLVIDKTNGYSNIKKVVDKILLTNQFVLPLPSEDFYQCECSEYISILKLDNKINLQKFQFNSFHGLEINGNYEILGSIWLSYAVAQYYSGSKETAFRLFDDVARVKHRPVSKDNVIYNNGIIHEMKKSIETNPAINCGFLIQPSLIEDNPDFNEKFDEEGKFTCFGQRLYAYPLSTFKVDNTITYQRLFEESLGLYFQLSNERKNKVYFSKNDYSYCVQKGFNWSYLCAILCRNEGFDLNNFISNSLGNQPASTEENDIIYFWKNNKHTSNILYNLACIYAINNIPNASITYLKLLIERASIYNDADSKKLIAMINTDSDFSSIKENKEFIEIVNLGNDPTKFSENKYFTKKIQGIISKYTQNP